NLECAERIKGGVMANPVVHFEVVGKNADALQSFYKDIFNWQIQPAVPGYAMALPGTGINGGIGGDQGGGAGRVTFYVEVKDIDSTLRSIEKKGGKTVQQPMDVPNGPRIALFSDPEGHVIGLIKAGSGTAARA